MERDNRERTDLENVYCDIAMVNHWEVMEYLFRNFDRKRIIYGTDLPIGICGGKSVEINNQYTDDLFFQNGNDLITSVI